MSSQHMFFFENVETYRDSLNYSSCLILSETLGQTSLMICRGGKGKKILDGLTIYH